MVRLSLVMLKTKRRYKVLIEEEATADWLPSRPNTKVDLILYLQDELHIIDWKTGRIPVDVVDNKQLMYYAVTYAYLAPKAKGAWLHVVQPWADNNIERVFVPFPKLWEFQQEAVAADEAILALDVTFSPSDKACMFCPANPHGRGQKGTPYCPILMELYYPMPQDTDALLED